MISRRVQRIRRIANVALIALFLLAIWLPICDSLFGIDRARTPVEKRKLAEKPEFKWQWTALTQYPREFEAYFNDHFGFRNWLIDWHNRMKVQWLGTVSSPKVIKGKEGWLFFVGDRILDYCCRATDPFSEEELSEWRKEMEERRDWLAGRGIPFLLVIAPNKHTVYSDYLPDWATRGDRKSRLEQLLEYMRVHSDIEILDLRKPLLDARKQGRIYHMTDSHWNDLGAYVAYREMVIKLSQCFPSVKPLGISDFEMQCVTTPGGDLAALLGQHHTIREDRVVLVPRKPRLSHRVDAGELMTIKPWPKGGEPVVMECPEGEIPRAVMFRDSYSVALLPFLSEHFGRIAYIWQHDFNKEVIEIEKPDVVIHEIVERLLTRVIEPQNQDDVLGQ
jgi:alginate O-acetyltransferase complex protein AlgJ